MRSLSRRDLFPAFGATALAGIAAAGLAKPETLTAAPAAKPEGKDAVGIALCERFIKDNQFAQSFYDGVNRIDDDDRRDIIVNSIYDRNDEVVESIALWCAVTPEGIKAKARALAVWAGKHIAHNAHGGLWEDTLLLSLLRDLAPEIMKTQEA
ncbi:hypothetical protein AA18889_1196 [Acetobacter senegalensis DSM 18889]|nr:hypothetical protein AA18889_1196 [Acetobacter senegalensis DSM 18889]